MILVETEVFQYKDTQLMGFSVYSTGDYFMVIKGECGLQVSATIDQFLLPCTQAAPYMLVTLACVGRGTALCVFVCVCVTTKLLFKLNICSSQTW